MLASRFTPTTESACLRNLDSIYVAIADEPASAPAAHDVMWLTAAELAEHPDVVDNTRALAKELFAMIESLPT